MTLVATSCALALALAWAMNERDRWRRECLRHRERMARAFAAAMERVRAHHQAGVKGWLGRRVGTREVK